MYIQIIHGPNLNLLGKREPEHYGVKTLADINRALALRAQELDIKIDFFNQTTRAIWLMLSTRPLKMEQMES